MDSENEIVGYTVAYDRDEIRFPVYVVALVAVVLFAAAAVTANPLLLAVSLAPAAATYYNYPLLETGRPRLGAGQYGIFIEGLGLIQWRAIADLDLVANPIRGVDHRELTITLKMPVADALLLDWRRRPWLRAAMRLPWRLGKGDVIRIALEVFDQPTADIHGKLDRMWRYFRKQ